MYSASFEYVVTICYQRHIQDLGAPFTKTIVPEMERRVIGQVAQSVTVGVCVHVHRTTAVHQAVAGPPAKVEVE